MNSLLSIIVLLLITLALFGIQLYIFQAKWSPFWEGICLSFQKLHQSKQQDETKLNETQIKKSLSFHKTGHKVPMLMLFAVMYPIFYIIINSRQSPFIQKDPIVLPFIITGVLLILVVGILGHYETNLSRKFWMELFTTLAIEFAFVFEVSLLLHNLYQDHSRLFKNINSLIFISIFFFNYIRKTQHNWTILQRQ